MEQLAISFVPRKRRPDVRMDGKRKFYGENGWMHQYLTQEKPVEAERPYMTLVNHTIFEGGKKFKTHHD